jgi:hypothetical protein
MLKKVCLTAAVLALTAMPTLAADECGATPIAPAFPLASELAQKPVEAARKDVVDSYHLVKTYQAALGTYRACLLRLTKGDEDAIAAAQDKKDDAAVKAAQQRIADRQSAYDKTVDSETQIVTDFNTLRLAHCQRDTDPKICPQKK